MSGKWSRSSMLNWMAATIATVVLSACIIINPPPATPLPTPQPTSTPTPTPQTVTDIVRFASGNDPVVVAQAVIVELALDEDDYSDRGRWQWERSDDGLSDWENVPATRLTDSSIYSPVVEDEEKYLRTSVVFLDSEETRKRGISKAIGPVVTAEIDTDTVDFDFGHEPPVVNRAIRVELTLADAAYSELGHWKWERSNDGLRGWVDVTDYDADDSSIYTPEDANKDKYLRASATYLDSDDKLKRGLSPTIGPVITVATVANTIRFTAGGNPPRVGSTARVEITLAQDKYSNRSRWKWERSEDGLRNWEDITDYDAGSSSSYTPVAVDEGHYLRVSALYLDSEGTRKRALSPTIGPVAAR